MTAELLARLLEKVEGRYYGKYRAFVVDNADPENRGRLRLRIPSVLGDDVISGWALPCSPYGGASEQGFFFIPEIDAGVWAEFEAGNLDYPVWVGTFWSKPGGTTEVPEPGNGQSPPTSKIIKTKTGHTVQLEDADGEEKIIIKHKDNSFISIDKDGSVIIGNQKGSTIILNAKDENIVLVEQHGNSVTMTADGIVIVNKDGSAAVELSADMARVAAKTIVLQGTTVTLGQGAQFPTIVVDPSFQTMWNLFVTAHTHATALGPSGPPLPLGPQLLPGTGLTSAVLVK
jgi:uncharacterized protein involved in type VI secretion and phage assembly